MSRSDKALTAVIRYEQAASSVKAITPNIGLAIARCDIYRLAGEVDFPGKDTQALWDGKYVKTHLWQAYNETTDADCYHEERRLNDGEQEEYLRDADCPHCLEAWRLIQRRKDARKTLGAAKRAIRQIGKAAIREGEPK